MIVLAIYFGMLIARRFDDIGVLRVKAEAEALQKLNGLESSERGSGFPLSEVLFANDLLDHLGGFLLEEFEVFRRGVTPLRRTRCSLYLWYWISRTLSRASEGEAEC